MHSSRMRTGRSSTVCRSLLPGECLFPGGSGRGVSALGGVSSGGVCSGGVCTGGVCSGGLLLGGVCSGVCSWGVSAPRGRCLIQGGLLHGGGGSIPACTEADTPHVNRITHTCKNITLAQLRCGR